MLGDAAKQSTNQDKVCRSNGVEQVVSVAKINMHGKVPAKVAQSERSLLSSQRIQCGGTFARYRSGGHLPLLPVSVR